MGKEAGGKTYNTHIKQCRSVEDSDYEYPPLRGRCRKPTETRRTRRPPLAVRKGRRIRLAPDQVQLRLGPDRVQPAPRPAGRRASLIRHLPREPRTSSRVSLLPGSKEL